MNMVFQSFNLFSHLSVLENLTLGPVKLRGMSRQAAQKKSLELLKLVGLAEKSTVIRMNSPAARSSVSRSPAAWPWVPEIILFDEPTSALTPPWSVRSFP